MSDSLTDGFVPSEINDHKPESSINRILDEARIDSEQFCNYLKAAFSEAPQDILDKLASTMVEVGDDNLEQALASVLEITRKGLFVQLSDALFILKWKIDEFPEQYRESARTLAELENDATSLQNPLWHAYMPSHQAELIAEHIWTNDPERFFQFAKKYAKASDFMWKVVFRLYEGLVDKREPASIGQLFDVSPLIWNTWWNLQNDEESYGSYKKRMAISVKWHKRLVSLGLLSLAKEFEKSCPRPRGTGSEVFEYHREKKNQMEWERLSHTAPLETEEDKKRCIELSLSTGNSFLDPDCKPEVVAQLISVSAEVNCWGEYLQDLESMSLRTERFFNDIRLHELWYASDHRTRWVEILDTHLNESDISRQLLILDHLLKSQSWGVSDREEYPVRGFSKWAESCPRVEVEGQHWNAWYKCFKDIGEAFLKGEIRLSYEELMDWIRIAIDHGYRSSLKRADLVPYADKALAFMRPYLNEPPEDFKIESCEMAYRILLTYAPDRLLKNFLPVILKAELPCSGDKLEYGAGSGLHVAKQYEHPILWWICVMISNTLRVSLAWSKRSEFIREDDVRATLSGTEIDDVNLIIRKTVAEFCLKQLVLKKGKSCQDNEEYSNEDCVEERPLWRQAFAQALSEIGLDLGGAAHKRLNFVKKSDPNDGVRKAAAEAYKSVRRKEHRDEEDPVKGLLIAFWWIRLAQRKSLGLEVDPAGATKTRRNELRYASHVREVVYEIQQISTEIL